MNISAKQVYPLRIHQQRRIFKQNQRVLGFIVIDNVNNFLLYNIDTFKSTPQSIS